MAPSSSKSSLYDNQPAAKRSKSITIDNQSSRSDQTFTNLIKPSTETSTASSVFKKRHYSASPSSSSSSLSSCIEAVDVDVPFNSKTKNLNSVDAEKKKYLDSHKLYNPAAVLANKTPQAIEAMKKLKCIETAKYLAQKPKKRKECLDLNLTQVLNIAKAENLARLNERDTELRNQEKQSSNQAVSNGQYFNSNSTRVNSSPKPLISKNSEQSLFSSVITAKPPIPKPSTPKTSSSISVFNKFKTSYAASSNKLENSSAIIVENISSKSNEASFMKPNGTSFTRQADGLSSRPTVTSLTRPATATSSKPNTISHAKPTNVPSSKSNEILSAKPTNVTSKRPNEVLEGNGGILGDIMNLMNENHANMNNNANVNNQRNPQEKKYKIDDFFSRIHKWNYKWIEEQEKKEKSRQTAQVKIIKETDLPPIVDFRTEIFPVVDGFNSYRDYYNTMLPYLLLETWEEIRNELREHQQRHNEKRTYQSAPIWLKSIEKNKENNDIVKLVFQSKEKTYENFV